MKKACGPFILLKFVNILPYSDIVNGIMNLHCNKCWEPTKMPLKWQNNVIVGRCSCSTAQKKQRENVSLRLHLDFIIWCLLSTRIIGQENFFFWQNILVMFSNLKGSDYLFNPPYLIFVNYTFNWTACKFVLYNTFNFFLDAS